MNNFITNDWLNLRSEPVVRKGNVIEIMPPDTIVEKTDDGQLSGWLKVKLIKSKTLIEGYAAEKFLQATGSPAVLPDEELPTFAAAHLKTNKSISRSSVEGRAYPLNEPGLVRMDLKAIPPGKGRQDAIHKVISYLDVEQSVRYSPTTKNTFCNIYATDLAYCLGLYIPRVWWKSEALAQVKLGAVPEARYDQTVSELNANSLANWFENYGTAFRWKRVLNLTSLQNTVNPGTLGIIVAQRIDLNRSGHIVAVVPEKADVQAKRDNDHVLSPLQSQAGVVNKKYFTGSNWWEKPDKFRKFGFWVYDI